MKGDALGLIFDNAFLSLDMHYAEGRGELDLSGAFAALDIAVSTLTLDTGDLGTVQHIWGRCRSKDR